MWGGSQDKRSGPWFPESCCETLLPEGSVVQQGLLQRIFHWILQRKNRPICPLRSRFLYAFIIHTCPDALNNVNCFVSHHHTIYIFTTVHVKNILLRSFFKFSIPSNIPVKLVCTLLLPPCPSYSVVTWFVHNARNSIKPMFRTTVTWCPLYTHCLCLLRLVHQMPSSPTYPRVSSLSEKYGGCTDVSLYISTP